MNTRKGRICKIRFRVLQKTLTLNDFVMNKFSVHLIPSSMFTAKKNISAYYFPFNMSYSPTLFVKHSIYNSIGLNI